MEDARMAAELAELDQLQGTYKGAVDEWVAAIRAEEALASVNHDIAQIDAWERAGIHEDELRQRAKAAKKAYEDALREKFYHF
jgi:hypothetical protein